MCYFPIISRGAAEMQRPGWQRQPCSDQTPPHPESNHSAQGCDVEGGKRETRFHEHSFSSLSQSSEIHLPRNPDKNGFNRKCLKCILFFSRVGGPQWDLSDLRETSTAVRDFQRQQTFAERRSFHCQRRTEAPGEPEDWFLLLLSCIFLLLACLSFIMLEQLLKAETKRSIHCCHFLKKKHPVYIIFTEEIYFVFYDVIKKPKYWSWTHRVCVQQFAFRQLGRKEQISGITLQKWFKVELAFSSIRL